MGEIVVGVDGSAGARVALAWAMREAMVRQASLTAVTVRPVPVAPLTEYYWPDLAEAVGVRGQVDQAIEHHLRELVDKVAAEIGGNTPQVTVLEVDGDPAAELIKASQEADLLVVGTRGNGGFARLLLGSVSTKVVHHAPCPVVVVPGRW